ncbi:MAG: CusA/CzcA family heavy metal efflux RND transporter [Alphaproteobacteria bacterium]|jgi:CzcA family heavy metal efflux pump|nr:CusA/CzcA family heavy metal efflux RND transporter [Alphaproteobacteria bacterium]
MFTKIIEFSLKYRWFILFSYLAIIIYGSLLVPKLPVDVFPDLNRPTVTIMTEASGLAPEEVEQLVSFPIETAMNGLPGVIRVRSTSGIGLSIVFVEFDWGTEIYRNRQVVSERLDVATAQLPLGIKPILGPVTSIMGEILLIGVSSLKGETSPMELRGIADWILRPQLLSIAGVAQVIPIGGEVKQYQILPNINRLWSYNVSLEDILKSAQGFGQNKTGGYLEGFREESLVRYLGNTTQLEDLQKTIVRYLQDKSLTFHQVSSIQFGAAIKRGDASVDGKPAVILSIQKQPGANTTTLTTEIEKNLQEIQKRLPPDIKADRMLFKQATFIENSIYNVEEALEFGAVLVLIILFLFLMNIRTTFISLTAIPISILMTAIIFKWFGLSINTMTLGGLAIAIGELVDDAVVDVENIFRRLRENRLSKVPKAIVKVVRDASLEVRSSIVYATGTVIFVFLPLFALSGIEGRLFTPLGVAYIISILASLVVSVTLTPVLSSYLLPNLKVMKHGDSWLVRHLKSLDTKLLNWSFLRGKTLIFALVAITLLAASSVPFLGKSFLPSFNEGSVTINLRLAPGMSLSESNRIGTIAEKLLLEVPEVKSVGRRSGRAELDEHAEGVYSSEIDVDLAPSKRARDMILNDIRTRLATLSDVVVNIGQPISHRLDHLLSGVRAEIVIKVFGDNLSILREQAETIQEAIKNIPGLTDLQIEQQTLIPQLQIHPKREEALKYGVNMNQLGETIETLLSGKVLNQILEGSRRYDLVVRLTEEDRHDAEKIGRILIDSPSGKIPLKFVTDIRQSTGPNQILRDNTQRRIVVMANTKDRALVSVAQDVQERLSKLTLPEGYSLRFEGQFESQQAATRLIALLSIVALAGIFILLYSHFKSAVLTLIIMANVPMALIGSVAAIWLSNQTLSVASLVGFITLTGIATRNGILKIAHYIHLMKYEGESFGLPMIIRGSLERLTPVLMTALVAAFALVPLMIGGDQPGKEILHPVAVVIFGGLISSTLLDTLITPVIFWLVGERAIEENCLSI